MSIILESNILSNPILSVYEWKKNRSLKGSVHKIFSWHTPFILEFGGGEGRGRRGGGRV